MNAHPSHYVALIPAAGIGSRMQADVPKQYLCIAGKTILEYSIDAMLNHAAIQRVVVALHPQDKWFELLAVAKHPKVKTVVGGNERADSVLAGLQICSDNEWVLVHDAARPCVREQDISRLIAESKKHSCGAILAAKVIDTIKRSDKHMQISATLDRDVLWRAYTPQLFPVNSLCKQLSAAKAAGQKVTDEASAMELGKIPVHLVQGASDNIKITQPEDLALAEWYLSQQGRLDPVNETK